MIFNFGKYNIIKKKLIICTIEKQPTIIKSISKKKTTNTPKDPSPTPLKKKRNYKTKNKQWQVGQIIEAIK